MKEQPEDISMILTRYLIQYQRTTGKKLEGSFGYNHGWFTINHTKLRRKDFMVALERLTNRPTFKPKQ